MYVNSAGGLIALLTQSSHMMNSFALKKLLSPYISVETDPYFAAICPPDGDACQKSIYVIDVFWAEISDHIETVEKLYEDEGFGDDRFLAAIVASKIYFHLGSYEDALFYALAAKDKFDLNEKSEFVDTIVGKCIDLYISKRNDKDHPKIDEDLENVVNRMFERCFVDKKFEQALGVAIESKRLDMFSEAIARSDCTQDMLSYAFRICMTLIQGLFYRSTLLKALVELYKKQEKPDFVQMCQCLIFLGDPESVANVLKSLYQGSEDQLLMAYQIAFDMYESATQQFLEIVLDFVIQSAPNPSLISTSSLNAAENNASDFVKTDKLKTLKEDKPEMKVEDEDVKMDVEKEKTGETTSKDDELKQKRVFRLAQILSGNKTIFLNLQFLMRSDHTDMQILKQTKDAVRVSICHTATVIANGFMHCGTTHDSFLRDNLEWLRRATNWSKLSATASLGVIHRGHESESLSLMQSYLPPKDASGSGGMGGSSSSSGYAEGGALYALGIIHANHGGFEGASSIIEYLIEQINGSQDSGMGAKEPIRHGGCLGLGLAAMGTHRQDVYDLLKANLYYDDAVTGEAAGIAMGLVWVGSVVGNVESCSNAVLKATSGGAGGHGESTLASVDEALVDMLSYARETQHEKIVRGLSVGISLLMYGRLEDADPLIQTLMKDKDPILRRAAMNTIAMAYSGTGSNSAIRILLHVAVSDVNDDVRRAAVIGIGFVLLKNPDHCPGVVSLLSESYNPHVRYGAAMALGVACAGTGMKEAMALIEPLTRDAVNFVRQGALIASALILIQQTEFTCCDSKVKEMRTMYAKCVVDKHEDVMVKFGAILAQGIIDGGGRNATISLTSRTGHTNMMSVVGMHIFIQYWYWFPLTHFLSLAFTPSSLIGLNIELEMPVMAFKSNAKPSTYAYPKKLEEKKKDDKEKVATAVLSITAKSLLSKKKKAAAAAKKNQTIEDGTKMDVEPKKETTSESKDSDGKKKSPQKSSSDSIPSKDTGSSSSKDDTKEKREKGKGDVDIVEKEEPDFVVLHNPARIIKPQLKVISLNDTHVACEKEQPPPTIAKSSKSPKKDEGGGKSSKRRSNSPSKKEKESAAMEVESSSGTKKSGKDVAPPPLPTNQVYKPMKPLSIGGIIMMKNVSGNPCDVVKPLASLFANSASSSGNGGDKKNESEAAGGVEDEPEQPEPFLYDESQDDEGPVEELLMED